MSTDWGLETKKQRALSSWISNVYFLIIWFFLFLFLSYTFTFLTIYSLLKYEQLCVLECSFFFIFFLFDMYESFLSKWNHTCYLLCILLANDMWDWFTFQEDILKAFQTNCQFWRALQSTNAKKRYDKNDRHVSVHCLKTNNLTRAVQRTTVLNGHMTAKENWDLFKGIFGSTMHLECLIWTL